MTFKSVKARTFLGLGSFQWLSFMRRGVFYSFMYRYLFDLMGNVTITTLLGTLDMIASSLGQNLLWGRISDRYRLRAKLIIMGEVIAGFAYIAVFLTHTFLLSVGSYFFAGLSIIVGLAVLEFFWSMSDVGWASLLTDVTTPEIRGGFVGTLNFLATFGRMIGIVAAGFLYEGGRGFREGTIFYIVTAMLFTGAAIMWFSSMSVKPTTTALIESPKAITEPKETYDVNERIFKWFLISLIIVVLGSASVNQVFLLFLQLPEGLNTSDLGVSAVLSAWTIGGMAISVLSGMLADRVGRGKVILSGFIKVAATPLFYGIAPNVGFMALVYGINGASVAAIQTAGFAFAGDIIPAHRRGRLFSRYNAVMALSWGPAGLLIGGPLADVQTRVLGVPRYLAYVNVFIASSILVCLGTVVFLFKVKK